MKRTWNLVLVLQIVQKVPENYCPCLYYQLTKFDDITFQAAEKIYLKMHPVSCTNTHDEVADLVNHGMVKNIKA